MIDLTEMINLARGVRISVKPYSLREESTEANAGHDAAVVICDDLEGGWFEKTSAVRMYKIR